MADDDAKVEIVSSSTPQKEHSAADAGVPTAVAAEQPRASAAANAQTIAPSKRRWHWYTPFGIAKDFVVGTLDGFGNGLHKGAKLGIKIGVAVAVVAFLAPYFFPALATGLMNLGLPALATVNPTTLAPMFINNGLMAFVDTAFYALAGGVIGAAGGAVAGTLGGGAHELKLRGRRDKYAEELAERGEMRARQQARGRGSNWREYDKAYKQYDNQRQLRWFDLQQNQLPVSEGGWASKIEAERAAGGNDRGR